MKIFHVAVDSSTAELEALQEVKPPRLLLSYYYFRNKPLKDYLERLGYKPEIILDSGAWSAFSKGKGIALTDYMRYIEENKEWINMFFSLDVMNDSQLSYRYWQIMRERGFKAIPVYHYGSPEMFLDLYANQTDFIGLGGTVPIKDKNAVSEWVRMISWQYPEVKFHLLGSSSRKILDHCDIYSVDSSTWFMMAINGKPQEIKGNSREMKIQRAIHNLKKELELVSEVYKEW